MKKLEKFEANRSQSVFANKGYRLDKPIAKGSTGDVFNGFRVNNGNFRKVAFKRIRTQSSHAAYNELFVA